MSFPKRAADEADGATSPEELVAAAHSACYAMSLSGNLAPRPVAPSTPLDVKADVTLGPDKEAGGSRTRPASTLTVRGEVEGLDDGRRSRTRPSKAKAELPDQQGARPGYDDHRSTPPLES